MRKGFQIAEWNWKHFGKAEYLNDGLRVFLAVVFEWNKEPAAWNIKFPAKFPAKTKGVVIP